MGMLRVFSEMYKDYGWRYLRDKRNWNLLVQLADLSSSDPSKQFGVLSHKMRLVMHMSFPHTNPSLHPWPEWQKKCVLFITRVSERKCIHIFIPAGLCNITTTSSHGIKYCRLPTRRHKNVSSSSGPYCFLRMVFPCYIYHSTWTTDSESRVCLSHPHPSYQVYTEYFCMYNRLLLLYENSRITAFSSLFHSLSFHV